jgi:hypothetical protein
MTTPLRRSARLQQGEDRNARSEIVGARAKKRRLLPSPSTSLSFGEQVRGGLALLTTPLMYVKRGQRLASLDSKRLWKASPVALPDGGLWKPKTTKRIGDELSDSKQKRKKARVQTNAVKISIERQSCESTTERIQEPSFDHAFQTCLRRNVGERGDWHPVEHWASTLLWPSNFANMSQEQSDSSRKRGRGSSYTQSIKDGEAPKAHTRAFEGHIAQYGILMEERKGQLFLAEASKALCETLLLGRYEEPQYTQFPLSKFLEVCDRLRTRNEYRIFKDITPLLVPSAELLYICGHDDLEHIAEEVSADWTKSDPMGGPKPRPDFAAGISSSAFTDEEVSKLKNHTAWERATMFTDNMYFPFLLCEAKSGDQGINRADRQNAQSGSMAVNAVVQLHRVLGDKRTSQLSGQILVFSVSHDNERVKIYGHYAVIEGARSTFYRYPIESFTLNFHEGQGRKGTYDFVREIYHSFYPEHLKRIQNALAEMEDPRAQSMTSSMSIEESESQEMNPGASSSQQNVVFKKPNAPASKKQKGEMALLREQLVQQDSQSKERLVQQDRQSKEQMALLERQMALLEKQMAQQEKQYKEQIDALKQLLDRR